MGVPRELLPSWDDIQLVTAQLATPPQLDDVPVGTEVVIGRNAQAAADAEDPAARLRHELRLAVAAGEDRARARRRAGRHRHLLGRGRHAGRGAGRLQPLFLRARLGALRLLVGQGDEGAGLPLQGRPGGEDRHRRPPAGPQGVGQDRRGARAEGRRGRDLAGALSRVDRGRAVPGVRRRGARAHRRHPDRLQAVGPAHRAGHRRGAGDRLRLHHPRRPRRRDRRGAADLPRQHLGADHSGAGPRAPPSRRGRRARTSR